MHIEKKTIIIKIIRLMRSNTTVNSTSYFTINVNEEFRFDENSIMIIKMKIFIS